MNTKNSENKKTIGIITIQKSLVSYGASLQAHALWAYISSIGYDCEIIDLYRPVIKGYLNHVSCLSFSTYKKQPPSFSLKKIIKDAFFFFRKLSKVKQNSLKEKRFESFNRMAKYSTPYKSINLLYKKPPRYNIYISGSDQIWNPDMPFENEPYLLSFAKNNHNCISYASSFGRNNLPKSLKSSYATCLQKYKALSVREKTGAEIIEELIGIKPDIVLDPTMLFNKNYWHSIAETPSLQKKYVVYFFLRTNREMLDFALQICKSKNLALVSFSDLKILPQSNEDYIRVKDAGPKEWLGWMENAEFVVTDSFHGTAFSIIFQKQFFSYIFTNSQHNNTGSRIKDLLIQLSLEHRLVNNNPNGAVNLEKNRIDYTLVNDKLERLRNFSKDYLNKELH